MRYPTVFWDIDGTIFHGDDPPGGFDGCPTLKETAETGPLRAEHVLRMFGHQPPADLPRIIDDLFGELRERHGRCYSIEMLAEALYQRLGLEHRAGERLLMADAIWGARYKEWVFEGCADALAALHRAGVSMGVITNNMATGRMVRGALAGVGLAGFFGPVVCSCEVGALKPDPRIFNAALAAASPPAKDSGAVLYVGDNPVADVEGAVAAGWDAALHLTDPAAAPPPSKAVLTFTDYQDVVELVLGERAG